MSIAGLPEKLRRKRIASLGYWLPDLRLSSFLPLYRRIRTAEIASIFGIVWCRISKGVTQKGLARHDLIR
jgi:hypothetical protein